MLNDLFPYSEKGLFYGRSHEYIRPLPLSGAHCVSRVEREKKTFLFWPCQKKWEIFLVSLLCTKGTPERVFGLACLSLFLSLQPPIFGNATKHPWEKKEGKRCFHSSLQFSKKYMLQNVPFQMLKTSYIASESNLTIRNDK